MAGKVRNIVNRSGRYCARLVVPKDLRGIVGKTELRLPLRGDYRQALKRLPGGAVSQLQLQTVAERLAAEAHGIPHRTFAASASHPCCEVGSRHSGHFEPGLGAATQHVCFEPSLGANRAAVRKNAQASTQRTRSAEACEFAVRSSAGMLAFAT